MVSFNSSIISILVLTRYHKFGTKIFILKKNYLINSVLLKNFIRHFSILLFLESTLFPAGTIKKVSQVVAIILKSWLGLSTLIAPTVFFIIFSMLGIRSYYRITEINNEVLSQQKLVHMYFFISSFKMRKEQNHSKRKSNIKVTVN